LHSNNHLIFAFTPAKSNKNNLSWACLCGFLTGILFAIQSGPKPPALVIPAACSTHFNSTYKTGSLSIKGQG
jgi:hypothetical protein